MVEYSCLRCLYKTDNRKEMINHLTCKFLCPVKFKNLSREECLYQVLAEKIPESNVNQDMNNDNISTVTHKNEEELSKLHPKSKTIKKQKLDKK